MKRIKDKVCGRVYTFTLQNKLIDIEERGVSIWSKDSNKIPHIPNNVLQTLKQEQNDKI